MTISVYSLSASPLGKSIYRFNEVTAPAQFVPELVVTTVQNASGTNINYKVDVDYPLLVTTDGVTTAPNHFKIRFEFTSLRSVISSTERERIVDEFIAFLTSHKGELMAGSARPLA